MPSGRLPKSTADLKLHGRFRKDRHGDRADVENWSGAPEKPTDLDADASWLWDTVTSSMPKAVLAKADTMLLLGMCEWWSRWREHNKNLREKNGDPYKVTVMATVAWKNFAACATQFGLSPSARAALKLPKTDSHKQSGVMKRTRA